MNDLRLVIGEITNNGVPESHGELIDQLREHHPHGVYLQESAAPIGRYTCVMHALNLVEDQEYEDIVQAAPRDIFASPRFVERLIERGVLMPVGQPAAGSLVVYLEKGRVKHIGTLLGPDLVESKWGVGHLYRHGLFEIPANYGSEVCYVAPILRDQALDEYVEYAREHGVRFQGDALPPRSG